MLGKNISVGELFSVAREKIRLAAKKLRAEKLSTGGALLIDILFGCTEKKHQLFFGDFFGWRRKKVRAQIGWRRKNVHIFPHAQFGCAEKKCQLLFSVEKIKITLWLARKKVSTFILCLKNINWLAKYKCLTYL